MGFRQVPAVSRGSRDPKGFECFGFSGLLNINAMPQTVGDNELTVALNVYGAVDGGLEMRRGMAVRGTQFSASPGKNVVRFYQQVVGATPLATPLKFLLGQSGGTMWNVDTHTQIGATNALGVLAQSWETAIIQRDPATAGGTDILVICTGDGGPYLFDGTNITSPSTWASFAPNAKYCQLSNGTLWFSGIPSQPNTIVQMAIGQPQVYQQQFTTSYPVTGLSVLGAGSQSGLFFGMTQGVGVTFGVNSVDAYYQEIPHEDGCAAARTCIAVNGLVYFLGNFNIYSFDGQNITPIGNKVRPWIVCDPQRSDFPMNGNRQLSFSWFENDFIYFAYDSGNVGYCNSYLVWHLNQQGWTLLNGPKLCGATLLNAPSDPLPITCVVMDATKSQAYNWDVYNGTGTNNHGVDDAGQVIQTSILTKYFPLAGHGTRSRLTGVTPELFIESFAGSVVCATDYGASNFTDIIEQLADNSVLVWDESSWDSSTWGSGGGLQYFATPLQVDDQQGQVNLAYTFAFGITTNDTNPPYRFAGLSGEFGIEGRKYGA